MGKGVPTDPETGAFFGKKERFWRERREFGENSDQLEMGRLVIIQSFASCR
jgi:hypothetical protein